MGVGDRRERMTRLSPHSLRAPAVCHRQGVRPRRAGRQRTRQLAAILTSGVLLAGLVACASSRDAPGRAVIRIIGSDTMINLLQAWAEHYQRVSPAVVMQVAGGGSGVGIAGLIDGTLHVAAASREIRAAERERVSSIFGAAPTEVTVALDALAIYVHRANPAERISIADLAEIYGEHGGVLRWSQLAVHHPDCAADTIIRVGRQNNSGTYAYFRQVVLGPGREYKLSSIDQSGSKDVVALVSRTPCAIGYSGLAYATSEVKELKVAARHDGIAIAASKASVIDASYPLARPLYLYTATPPAPHVGAFLDWVLGPDGQTTVSELGFVPVRHQQLAGSVGLRDQ
jgi:phosphate transport system substrate-binding protein